MKLGPFPQRTAEPREPLYSFSEIAERLRVSPQALLGLFKAYRDCLPSPVYTTRCLSLSSRKTHYRLSDFRCWAAHHQLDFGKYRA